jgi:hypothetical protein
LAATQVGRNLGPGIVGVALILVAFVLAIIAMRMD